MPISHLEHLLIISGDLEATREWYVRVLCFRICESPDFGFPVCWLSLGGGDVLHIAQAPEGEGLREMLADLRRYDVQFVEQQLSDRDLYQVFLQDPNGVVIELNFPAAEGRGLQAPKVVLSVEKPR